MNTFVLSHVAPNVRKRLPESACLVFGRALMWLICSPVADEYVPVELKEQVMSDWADVCGTEFDAENEEVHRNPIQQLAVTVSGDHGAMFIDVISEELQTEGGGGGQGTNASVQNQLVGIQSCLLIATTGELGIEDNTANHHEGEFGAKFWDCERQCSKNCDSTGTVGGGGDDSEYGTKSRGSGASAAKCWGRPCNDACSLFDANPQKSS